MDFWKEVGRFSWTDAHVDMPPPQIVHAVYGGPL